MASLQDSICSIPLPTLDRLGAQIPENIDAKAIAKEWFDDFAKAAETGDIQRLSSLFVEESFWRDLLALSWDFRTFVGLQKISQFFSERLGANHINAKAFKLRDDPYLGLQNIFPDLAWIQFFFDFETDIGIASGIGKLVPTSTGEWKAHSIFTNLEDLKGFPEKIGSLRNHTTIHGQWTEERQRQLKFEDAPPKVIIVGGGHAGLTVAARLKTLEVSALVIDKNPRIGDCWRNRYDALCLHDPIWFDNLPYLPFPPTWPVYSPAKKLANWLESYAETLELNVWTSSRVTHARLNEATGKWTVAIEREDGSTTTFVVPYVVFATGFGSGKVQLPDIAGMDTFKGKILHSLQHKSAKEHVGKKVVVVGAGTSAHDICQEHSDFNVDVTMYQRSSTYVMTTKNGWKVLLESMYSENSPPNEISDRLFAATPLHVSALMAQRAVQVIAHMDKDLLEGLTKAGFALNLGPNDTGFALISRSRLGGYYFDTGASQLVADGKIKLKSGSQIERLTENGIKFEDGVELPADVVIFATGIGDSKAPIRDICGEDLASKCKPLWQFNEEGELGAPWGDSGIKGMWVMLGALGQCRFHSKHVALQIKALEEGIFTSRYSA